MPGKSIDEIYRKIETERQQRIQQERIQEQKIMELRELARQEYLKRNRMFEFVSTTTTTSSSAAAGAGGFPTDRRETPLPTSSVVGESILLLYREDDDTYNFFIYNYSTDEISTGEVPLDYNVGYWNEDRIIIVEEKGFIISFYVGEGEGYQVVVLSLDGLFLYNELVDDISNSDSNAISAYIKTRIDSTSTFVIYDGLVRTFDYPTSNDTSLYRVFRSGVILYNNGVYSYVKNGTTNLVDLCDQGDGSVINFNFYGDINSDNFASVRYSSSSGFALSMSVFNSDGVVDLFFDTSDFGAPVYFDFFRRVGSSGSFIANFYTDTVHYMGYYSHLSNTFTYKLIDRSVYSNLVYESAPNYRYGYNYDRGASFLATFYTTGFDNYNNLIYPDGLLFLPVFDNNTSIPDIITYSQEFDSRRYGFRNYFRTETDTIFGLVSTLGGSPSSTYELLTFTSGGYGLQDTTIDVSYNFISSDHMATRSYALFENDGVGIINFFDSNGFTMSSTFSTSNYQVIFQGDSFILKDRDNSKIFYSYKGLGNVSDYLTSSIDFNWDHVDVTSNHVDGDNIFFFDETSKTGFIISQNNITDIFTFSEAISDIEKLNFEITDNYVVFSETLEFNELDAITYSHTTLDIGGPVGTSSFISDGVVVTSDEIFGTGSSYFTNLYPGFFVFSAENIDIYEFRVFGNLGADGSGNVDSYSFTKFYNGVTYSAYIKRVYDAWDPSVNHIIITDTTIGTHSISSNTDDDFDSLANIKSASKLNFIVLSQPDGVKLTNAQITNVVNYYVENCIDGNDINQLLTYLNSNHFDISTLYTPYYFSDEGDSRSIGDGGSDMYDTGNKISAVKEFDPNMPDYNSRVVIYDLNGNVVSDTRSLGFDTYIDSSFHNNVSGNSQNGNFILRSDGTLYNTGINQNDIDETFYNDFVWWDD